MLQDLKKIQTNVRWERPVDHRLVDLLQLVRATGSRASRGELLASLVVAAPADGEELAEMVRRYRTASAESITLRAEVVDLDERRPGPVRFVSSGGE